MSVDYVICACRKRYNVKKHGTLIAISVQSIAPLMDGIDNRRVKLSDLPILKQTFEEVSSEDVTIGTTLTICTQHWKGLSKGCPISITLYGTRPRGQKLVVFRFLLQRADNARIPINESSDVENTLVLVPPSPLAAQSQKGLRIRIIRDRASQAGLFLVWTIEGERRARRINFGHVSGDAIIFKKLNEPDLDDFTGTEVCHDSDFYSGTTAFTSSQHPGIITVLRFD